MSDEEAFRLAVDEIVAWPAFQDRSHLEAMYRESARALLDGAWVGAYVQEAQFGRNGWMSMTLRQRGVVVEGEGYDPVGAFGVKARIDEAGRIQLLKAYVGQHTVDYVGIVGNDAMHGAWTISGTRYSGVWAMRTARTFDEGVVEALEERAVGTTEGIFGVVAAPAAPPGRVLELLREFKRIR
jgi:hypothetical protein